MICNFLTDLSTQLISVLTALGSVKILVIGIKLTRTEKDTQGGFLQTEKNIAGIICENTGGNAG